MALASGEDFLAGDVGAGKHFPELAEGAGGDMVADVLHDFHIHEAVVDAEHAEAEDFIDIQQVAEISARIPEGLSAALLVARSFRPQPSS